MDYVLSERALEDLNEIWVFTKKTWSIEQARRYYNLILEEFNYTCINFEFMQDYKLSNKKLKRSKVKSHHVYFKINEYNEIEILRILHERMDINNQLFD